MHLKYLLKVIQFALCVLWPARTELVSCVYVQKLLVAKQAIRAAVSDENRIFGTDMTRVCLVCSFPARWPR